jgi:hypothetical protein
MDGRVVGETKRNGSPVIETGVQGRSSQRGYTIGGFRFLKFHDSNLFETNASTPFFVAGTEIRKRDLPGLDGRESWLRQTHIDFLLASHEKPGKPDTL